ncbi:MAG: hypothetical protein HYV35_12435 [Lentisphaerae bacterium]|nr:hypothetical protein [Lentisphaerota bacterium]
MSAQVDLPVSAPSPAELAFTRRLAILLSCTACPGAGQFVQRRWLMGLLFVVLFTACMVMLLVSVIGPLMANLRLTLDQRLGSEPLRAISLFRVLGSFAAAALVYFVALADVIVYARRQMVVRQKNLEQP